MKQIPLLRAEDIEVKPKQATENGVVLLLYKNARTDMKYLDAVYGAENWTNDYKVIDGVLYCGIGIREDESKPFIWKWSNGIESREDGEGNEKKGEASDALKRAAFLVGIGRELYTSPFIFAKVPTVANGKGWKMQNAFAKFKCASIAYDQESRTITELTITDEKGNVVYSTTGKSKPSPAPKKYASETTVSAIWEKANLVGFDDKKIVAWCLAKFQKHSVDDLSPQEADVLLARLVEIEKEKIGGDK